MNPHLRRLTEGERRVLNDRMRPRSVVIGRMIVDFLAAAALMCIVVFGLDWGLSRGGVEWPTRDLFAAVGSVLGGVIWAAVSRRHLGARDRLIRSDLDEDRAEILDVRARDVWKYEEEGRPDEHYFFDLGDGELLLVGGQWVREASFPRAVLAYQVISHEELEAQRLFPCAAFTLVRAPHSGIVLRLERASEAITPGRSLGRSDLESSWWLRAGAYPESMCFRGTLETLDRDLARAVRGDPESATLSAPAR